MEVVRLVLAFGQFPVERVHDHKNVSDSNGLSMSKLLLPSRMISSSTGKLRDFPPSILTSGTRTSVVRLTDEINAVAWMVAAQVMIYVNPGISTDEGIVSAIPSVFIGFDAEIAGVIDQA